MQSVLGSLGVEDSPSHVHGLLCGLLCGGSLEKGKSLWFSHVLQGFGEQPAKLRENAEDIKSLDQFFHQSVEQLNDAEFGFRLLVEDEPATPLEQLVALAGWCSGFGLGFGMGDRVGPGTPLPEDTKELLGDFQEIARFETLEEMSPAEDDEEQNDQQDVVEIEEFVRVGVLLINEEMRPVAPGSQDTQPLPGEADSDEPLPPTLH